VTNGVAYFGRASVTKEKKMLTKTTPCRCLSLQLFAVVAAVVAVAVVVVDGDVGVVVLSGGGLT
jgi:hypothetical protein